MRLAAAVDSAPQRNQVSNILNKTNTANRTEAATYAVQQGITADLDPSTP